jgi:teichoic acid transport system permease protein
MLEVTESQSAKGLRDVYESSRLNRYLRGMWDRREYIRYVAVNELKSRQMNSVLGNLWHLLNPMLTIAVYWLIFGVVLKVDRGVTNFIAFITVGVFTFAFTQRSTTHGARSIVSNRGLIKAIRFPRAVLPASSTLTETLATLPPIAVMLAVAFLSGESITVRWLAVLPLFALQAVFNFGAALVAGRLTHHLRDVVQILPFFFRLLLYGSGVIFSVEAYADSSVRWLFILNPMYDFVTMMRWAVMGSDAEPVLLLSAVVWSALLSVLGFLWFRSAEASYGSD